MIVQNNYIFPGIIKLDMHVIRQDMVYISIESTIQLLDLTKTGLL